MRQLVRENLRPGEICQFPNPNWSLDVVHCSLAHCSLFFTIHNTLTGTLPFTLTVDAAALGIAEPAVLRITELTSGEVMPFEVQGELVQIHGDLAPLDTVVFRLATHRIHLPLIRKE